MAKELRRISSVIGTAGHVDHGKTSLVKALTGMDTDRLPEEKRRGVSIELGFAHIDFEGPDGTSIRAAVIDVPGHEKFIRNMLAGVTGVDLALICVAADDGVMPQTVEHLDILRLLYVKKAVFAVTKCDLAPQERVLKKVEDDILRLIKGTPLEASPIARVSSATGEGIDALKRLIRDNLNERRRSDDGFFRLPVDRSFSIAGFGSVVTGTVASGRVKKGEELIAFPSGERVKVRGIQSMHLDADEVLNGSRAAINISGLKAKDVTMGCVLASPELSGFAAFGAGDLSVDCSFEFLDAGRVSGASRFAGVKSNSTLKLHHLTGETLARIIFPGKGEARPGERAVGRLVLKKPLLMMRGDRFILRNPSINSTIGGGMVVWPRVSKRLRPGFDKAAWASTEDALGGLVNCLLPEGGIGLPVNTLSLMLNRREEEFMRLSSGEGAEERSFAVMGGFMVSLERLGALERMMTERLREHHVKNPMDAGVKEERLLKDFAKSLSSGIGIEKGAGLLKRILGDMASRGLVRNDSGSFALPSFRPGVRAAAEGLAALEGKITALFEDAGFTPPHLDDIKKLSCKKDEIEKVMAYLLKAGVVVKLREGSFISGKAVKNARDRLGLLVKANGSVKAAAFRDSLGCGRKLAIEILEYFDKVRVTLRRGDERVLR